MSIRTSERTQGDLTVIVKAKEMVIYTLRITESGKAVFRIKAKTKSHERQKLRKQKAKVERGELVYETVKESYQAWKAHVKRGDTYYVLQEMDCYFYELFINYLSDSERERYEKLKKYNEIRQRKKKQKQEVKNGKTIIKPAGKGKSTGPDDKI